VLAYAPPIAFVLSWLFALVGWYAPGTDAATPFAEQALRWVLYIALGWTAAVGSLMHTVFARRTAASIGWETNGFQYEVGFANLAVGLAGIYAGSSDRAEAWVAAAIAGGVFLLLAGLNHIVEIVRDGNYAPGSTAILVSDLGVPLSLFALLVATGAVL
jgi:predicted membrane channel-forming protein YqfA (hemolysin III family)